jgi:hypothetical protein
MAFQNIRPVQEWIPEMDSGKVRVQDSATHIIVWWTSTISFQIRNAHGLRLGLIDRGNQGFVPYRCIGHLPEVCGQGESRGRSNVGRLASKAKEPNNISNTIGPL